MRLFHASSAALRVLSCGVKTFSRTVGSITGHSSSPAVKVSVMKVIIYNVFYIQLHGHFVYQSFTRNVLIILRALSWLILKQLGNHCPSSDERKQNPHISTSEDQ